MGLFNGIKGGISSSLQTVKGALTQSQTNGKSTYGTFASRLLPLFLVNNPLPEGKPWGNKTDYGTNAYVDSPATGAIRSYDFTISRGTIAPDGYQLGVLLVNGQYPGPTIEANWGDQITVTVHNNITGPAEGTSLHWHGFLQEDTPWEDGVPGVTQCPIAPGSSYTYTFNATLYGSTWYHSHYSAQYSSGVVGPMVIYGPSSEASYDVDLGPIMLSDWYHTTYWNVLDTILAPNASPLYYSDNNLINGKMNFDCSTKQKNDTTPCTSNAGISKFTFQTNQTHRLRLVNTGSEGVQRFSIDGHIMTVIANDFVPIQPYNTTVVTLAVGQRSDVIVTANAGGPQSSWWMRSNITNCSLANQPYALAAIYYDEANTTLAPVSLAWNNPDPGTCTNDDLSLTAPLYPIAVTTPNVTDTFDVELFTNASGITLWKFHNVSFRADYNNPVLPLANQGTYNYPQDWNVINFYANQSIRIIVNNNSPVSHPMHLHGHNFLVLSEGPGQWDGSTIVRATNPQRRDTQLVRAQGHLVLQFDGNAGAWVFHCHIAWHASGGFLSSFIINPSEVTRMNIPSNTSNTCDDWSAWTNKNVPDQIDSGD